ncbi:PepSY domain-containing protein [Parahaliea mediterranea]|uniref:PepSY domain-containing protein n=1 Tax=Parahaliea mediterranea TaxID=651086 RepID=UPI0013006166|nr:PepSY domain-containing protein [Parahaliea mediterranea]
MKLLKPTLLTTALPAALATTLAVTGALFSATAAADSGLPRAELERLLASAADYGVSHFQEIDVEDGRRLDVEGWSNTGSRANLTLDIASGNLLRQQYRDGTAPAWSLGSADIDAALDRAEAGGIRDITSLEVDRRGNIEIDGLAGNGRELELSFHRDQLQGGAGTGTNTGTGTPTNNANQHPTLKRSELAAALNSAQQAGIARIGEVDVNRRTIEIDGVDRGGHPLEVRLARDSYQVLAVELGD